MTIKCTVLPQIHDDSPLGKLSQQRIVEYFDEQFEKFPNKIHIIFTESLLNSSYLNDFLNCPYDMEYTKDEFINILDKNGYELENEELYHLLMNNNKIKIDKYILYNYDLWKKHKQKYKKNYFVFPVPNDEINREIERRHEIIFELCEGIIGRRLTYEEVTELDANISVNNYLYPNNRPLVHSHIEKILKDIGVQKVQPHQVEDIEKLFLDYRIAFDTREDIVVEQIIKTIHNVQRKCPYDNNKFKVYLVFGAYHDFEYYNDKTDLIKFKRKNLLSNNYYCKRRGSCDIKVRTSIYNNYEYIPWKTKQT